jgi:hypothetical protein
MNEGVFANLLCATVLIVSLIVALGIFGRAMLEERQADRQHKSSRSDDDQTPLP